MGVDSRRPPLPAPTDVSSSAIGNTSDDLATDVSRRTDRTSYSIPEDGSPVTISTKKIASQREKELSQTSLLIEYFEGGKTTGAVHSRPSVRVRVTPSSSKKSRREGEHIQITETGRNRKPSYTRRISLPRTSDDPLIPSELSDSSSTRPPVEVEVLQNHSDLSQYNEEEHRRFIAQSDVSSMPTDSLLEGTPVIHSPQKRSLVTQPGPTVHDETVIMDTLKAPVRTRSLSRERLTQKAMKKIKEQDSSRAKESSSKGKSSSRRSSRSESTREFVVDDGKTTKTRSSKHRDDEHLGSSLQPSEISAISDRSAGQSSVRSGMTASSINNPKLLSAVEDAIKRLILPELNALKEEQKTQKNRYKFDEITRDSMAPVGSRENLRRVSKSSSSPNVSGKPGITSDDRGVILPPDTVKVKKRRSSRGSTSDRSHDTAIHEESSHRRSSREKRHTGKIAAAAALAGAGLTAAALKHHDSMSSMDYDRERRKRRSKSRSRSTSISESVEASPHKDRIPPIPTMESHVGTDITRDSIRSVDTDRPHSRSSRGERTPTREREIRDVVRGSPRHVISPTPHTPTKSPLSMRRGTATTFESGSPGSFSPVDAKGEKDAISGKTKAAGLAAAGLTGAALLAAHHHNQKEHTPDRGLSPVQSAASYDDVEVAEHDRVRSIRSGDSLGGAKKNKKKRSSVSIDSLSSSPTTNLAQSKKRPEGISLEQGYEILPEHERAETPQAGEAEAWFEHEHQENDRYRDEFRQESELGSSVTGARRETMYTDNSMDYEYGDRSLEDHDIRGVGANPEYVRTPVAVESAVASLHEPSILSVQSSQKSASVREPFAREFDDNMGELQQPASSRERWETIRDQAIANARQQSLSASPQASKNSLEDKPVMAASALPLLDEPEPEIGHGYEEGSEVTTNPSIIQGPIGGGYDHGDRSHWPYDPTPLIAGDSPTPLISNGKMPEGHLTRDAALLGAGAAAVGLGLAANNKHEGANDRELSARSRNLGPTMEDVQDEHWQDDVGRGLGKLPSPLPNQYGYTSPNARNLDEGYISNTVPGGEMTPDPYVSGNRGFNDQAYDQYEQEDPFTTSKKSKHLSGLSAGMSSPLYDGATGAGIDRIQSKDVVALMDHLTVRDAQRNARDTEILISLVRSAAEMRNQFDDMKKHIAEQDRLILQSVDKNTEATMQRVLGGPRPQPAGSPRGVIRRQFSEDGIDRSGEKKNIFRRALKGLSLKGNNDFGKIEDMLLQILDEVEGLKDAQGHGSQRPPNSNTRSNSHTRSTSLNSYENLRSAPDPGYEPEGQAGTSSSPAISAQLSNPSSKYLNGMHSGYDGRRVSEGHRISTVLEGDEEGDDYPYRPSSGPPQLQEYDDERNLTPTQELRRGNSLPLDTPPEQSAQFQHNSEQTPKTEKSKKHKSNTSSIFSGFPKISRWSKTTTSSAPDPETARNSTNKRNTRPYSEVSRSGSNLNVDNYDDDEYSLHEEDRIRSQTSLQGRGFTQGRSPSPLIPGERLSMEDPKYQAHRNSLNLQHPQPRPGPTHRHQTYLESQAVNYENPPTPDQDQWGNTPALALNRNRFSAGSAQTKDLSPVYSEGDEDAYSEHSASEQAHNRLPAQGATQGPPRPPKLRDDGGPLVPPKVPLSRENDHPDNVSTSLHDPIGLGYQSPFSNSGMHIASPLEPIQEVRYSLETDRSSARQVC
jgi:hypothetical protein